MALLEDPDANLRLSSIERVAAALDLELDVVLHPARPDQWMQSGERRRGDAPACC